MSFSNRNRKYGFQTPNKSNQDMQFDKARKIISNSNIQYQSTNNNDNNIKKNIGRPLSQKSNSIENRYFKNKYLYNKSYNDFYNYNSKKKIRINFKPIEENIIDGLNQSKKIDIYKMGSNQKIKNNESRTNNNKRKNKVKFNY